MSRVKEEPVGNTCPMIDKAIREIEEIMKEMDSFDEDSDYEDILNSISNWTSSLSDIGMGHSCTLEKLRDANLSLRNWGSDTSSYLEEEEQNVLELEEKVADLEDQKEELLGQIEDLRTELKEIEYSKGVLK